MATLFDVVPSESVMALFCGESGSGKTAAIASYGKLGPVLLMDFDKRHRGALGITSILGEECLKNVEIREYDIINSFEKVDRDMVNIIDQLKMGKCPYKTVVLESINTVESAFMRMVDRLAQTSKGTGVATGSLGGISIYGPAHYKFAAQGFRDLRDARLSQMKGINVILSCWVINKWGKPSTTNEKGETITKQYADNIVVGKKLHLTDKMAEEVPGYFDEVYEFGKDETGLTSKPAKHWVRFNTSIAKTANEKLKKAYEIDLTNKSFIDEYLKIVSQKG